MFSAGVLAAAPAGCAIAPAVLSEFGNDRAVVKVAYNFLGPTIDTARSASGLVARAHCEAMGKTSELVWSKRESGNAGDGEFVFLYACEIPGMRQPDDRPPGPSNQDDLKELALPTIETSHGEARRHRR